MLAMLGRTPVLLFAAVVTALLVFSCNPSQPSSSHSLLIYTPHGQDLLRDFIAGYKQAHPETEVQFLDMGSRQILERVRAERNRPQADLWWGAAHATFKTAADENLLIAYRPTWAAKGPAFSHDSPDRSDGTHGT